MKILSIIPARGGSKGVKDKHTVDFNGKPLIGYTIEDVLASELIDKAVVSTDSDKIAGIVKSVYDIEVIKRPAKFAKDDSPIEEALLHAVEYLKKQFGYHADIVVWTQANVPIRQKGIIDKVIKKLIASKADSCVTCYEADQVPEAMKIINKKGMLVPIVKDVKGIRRQEFPKRYLLDGSVLALRVENLYKARGIRKAHIYLGNNVVPVIQSDMMYTLEVDMPDDVALVKYYLNKIKSGHEN
ncbi:MAG: acylneuraminate cytidylyltransferase family protein [Candidatus Omnitrophica bacterium]|jgi:CMP-N-acetylneuraminic acid synthetase|nr:acylneuraminate cytidylyltransferase family protein [Candidatus Omnitrophota bacterium]